jgi:hypothetical protein
MKESTLLGKLLPSHPDILPILEEIREKYQIPPISPSDDSLKELLKFGLEIDMKKVTFDTCQRMANILIKTVTLFFDRAIVKGNIPGVRGDVLGLANRRQPVDLLRNASWDWSAREHAAGPGTLRRTRGTCPGGDG